MKKNHKTTIKLIAALTAALITLSALAACTGWKLKPVPTSGPEATEEAPAPTELPAATDEAVPTQAPTDEPAPTEAPTNEPAPTEAPSAGATPGYYKLIGGKEGGQTIDESTITAMAALGLYCYMLLEADGSGKIVSFGEDPEPVKWDDKQISDPDGNDPATYTMDGDTLTITAGDTVLIFRKSDEQPPKTGDVTPPKPPEHTERAGYYVLSGGKEMDTAITQEMIDGLLLMGTHVFIVLEPGGTGFINFMGSENELIWTDDSFYISEEVYKYSYENDKITFSPAELIEYIFTRSSEETPERGQYADTSDPEYVEDLLPAHPEDITFAGQTLVDNENVLITANRIIVDEDFITYGMEFTVTNRTGKTILATVEHALVNGVDVDCMLFLTLEPGATESDSTYFDIQDILACGGDDPSEIELIIKVSDYEDVFADPIYLGTSTVYPMGEDKAGPKFERSTQAGDKVIVDNEFVTVTVYDFAVDDYASVDFGSAALFMYVVNKTDKELLLSFDTVEVNGVKAESYLWESIYPGTSRFIFASWRTQELYSAGVKEEDINSISFSLEMMDRDSFNVIKTENISFTLK